MVTLVVWQILKKLRDLIRKMSLSWLFFGFLIYKFIDLFDVNTNYRKSTPNYIDYLALIINKQNSWVLFKIFLNFY